MTTFLPLATDGDQGEVLVDAPQRLVRVARAVPAAPGVDERTVLPFRAVAARLAELAPRGVDRQDAGLGQVGLERVEVRGAGAVDRARGRARRSGPPPARTARCGGNGLPIATASPEGEAEARGHVDRLQEAVGRVGEDGLGVGRADPVDRLEAGRGEVRRRELPDRVAGDGVERPDGGPRADQGDEPAVVASQGDPGQRGPRPAAGSAGSVGSPVTASNRIRALAVGS